MSENKKNESFCPLTGKPCHHAKLFNITEITKQGVYDLGLCNQCASDYLDKHPQGQPPPVVDPVVPSDAIVDKVAPPAHIQELVHSIFAELFPGEKIVIEKVVNADEIQTNLPILTPLSKPPCPACGLTIADFLKVKRLGCDQCWVHYEPELVRLLMQVHGASDHIGKVPKKYKSTAEHVNKINKLADLRLKMRIAVKSEDFETAAILRDTIDTLENELGN